MPCVRVGWGYLSSEIDPSPFHFHCIPLYFFDLQHAKTVNNGLANLDTIMIMPGMTETVDFTSYSIGTWLLHWCASFLSCCPRSSLHGRRAWAGVGHILQLKSFLRHLSSLAHAVTQMITS